MFSAHDRLAAELGRLAARLAAIQRRRAANEARLYLTDAYMAFVFAAGFARLGQRDRAARLAADAAAGLEPVIADPVHAFLIAAFSARIDQALARRPRHTPLPAPLIEQLHALDHVARYKVDRLREALPTLEPEPDIDAIGAFSRRERPPLEPPPDLVALLAIDDPTARAAQIASYRTPAASLAPDARAPLLAACLDAMLELPEASAMPLLVEVLPLLDDLPIALPARALTIAARFGWGELVPALAGALRARLPDASPGTLGPVISACLRALRGLGLHDELALLLAALEPSLGPDPDPVERERQRRSGTPPIPADDHRGLRLIRAGGLALLGEPRAQAFLSRTHAAVEDIRHNGHRLELVQDLAWGYAHGPTDLALEQLDHLAVHFERVTDSFATNTHYCVSALDFVDSLVHGITGLADDAPRAAERCG